MVIGGLGYLVEAFIPAYRFKILPLLTYLSIETSIFNDWRFQLADPMQFNAIPGKGVLAVINEKSILMGTKTLMIEHHIELETYDTILDSLQEEGKTAILMAVDNRLVAAFALTDKIKESASAAISLLIKMGIEVCMITGDNEKLQDMWQTRLVSKRLSLRCSLKTRLKKSKNLN